MPDPVFIYVVAGIAAGIVLVTITVTVINLIHLYPG